MSGNDIAAAINYYLVEGQLPFYAETVRGRGGLIYQIYKRDDRAFRGKMHVGNVDIFKEGHRLGYDFERSYNVVLSPVEEVKDDLSGHLKNIYMSPAESNAIKGAVEHAIGLDSKAEDAEKI